MDSLYYLIFITLILLSAFFSSTEIAIMSIPNHKIESLIREKRFGAKYLKHIKQNSDKLLITILIGNTLVNTILASLATSLAIDFSSRTGYEESLIVGLATGGITLALLMFGEIIPKSFAAKNSVFLALKAAYVYKILIFLIYPIVASIEFIVKIFTGSAKSHIITDEEIETFIDMGKDSGTLNDGEHQKLKNLLDFNDTTVEEVMVPRINMKSLSGETTISEAFDFYMENSYSRIPIYNGNIDKIDYFFTVRDLIKARENGLYDTKLKDLDSIKQVIKVPLNQPIDSVLKVFQKSYKHMAIVIDEYGGVAGLVTLEDIIEEVFGEIRDENDRGEADEIKKIGNNTYIIDPSILVDDILDEYNIRFETIGIDEKEFSGETVSFLITDRLERFPNHGEIIKFCINNDLDDKNSCSKNYLEFKVTKINSSKMEEVEVSMK